MISNTITRFRTQHFATLQPVFITHTVFISRNVCHYTRCSHVLAELVNHHLHLAKAYLTWTYDYWFFFSQVNCFYHGEVEGHTNSDVSLSTCSGLRYERPHSPLHRVLIFSFEPRLYNTVKEYKCVCFCEKSCSEPAVVKPLFFFMFITSHFVFRGQFCLSSGKWNFVTINLTEWIKLSIKSGASSST